MNDLAELYEGTRERIEEVVAARGDVEAAGAAWVPACPYWTVKDVIANLAGNGADVLAGNVEGAATEAWTAAQIEARRELTVEEVLAEWNLVGPKFAGMLADLPGRYGVQILADL